MFQNIKHEIQKPLHQLQNRETKSSCGTSGGSVAIEFTKNMQSGDEANETETHNKNNRWRYLQSRSIVGVESQHVISAAGSSRGRARAGGVSTAEAATAHSGCSGSGAAWSHDTRSCCGSGGCGLGGLRGASRHGGGENEGRMDR